MLPFPCLVLPFSLIAILSKKMLPSFVNLREYFSFNRLYSSAETCRDLQSVFVCDTGVRL